MWDARSRTNIDSSELSRGFKAPRPRSVARYGDRPRPNILRGLTVCIVLVPALLAAEAQAFPVRCRDMSAGTTPAACITGTNSFQFNPDCRSLVCDLESHVSVGPSVDFRSQVLPLAQRTVSYVVEFFNHDASCSNPNRVADQCLTCCVEQVRCYGGLVPGHPFQESPGTSGANRLDQGAGAPDTRTAVIEHPAVEEKGFGVCRVGRNQHAFDPEVATHDAASGLWVWNLDRVSQAEEPLFPDAFELGVFPSPVRQRARVCDGQKFTPKRDAPLGSVEVPPPYHRHHGTGELGQPPTLVRLGSFVSGANSLTERTRQLRGKPHFPKIGIMGFCQPIRVKLPSLEGNIGKPIRRLQPNSKQPVSLRAAGNLELDCADCFHYIEYYYQEKTMPTELRKNNHRVSQQTKAALKDA